ncbi:hypothetical protein ISCGN_009880 [Ixodes scapularis]
MPNTCWHEDFPVVLAGGTCESRCLESGVSTNPEPCGFARPRLTERGFPVSGEKGILVVEPSPGNQKPRRTEQPPPPKGPTLSSDEKKDESLLLSEDDQSLPETESLPLVSSEVVGRPKDTAKKKTIRRGTCESRCLVSGVTTDPEPCGFARPRLAVRGFPVSEEKDILVVELSPGGPAPRSESKATQVSPETLAADLRAPAPRQGQQQLSPAPGGGTRAAPPSKGRPAAAAPSPSPRSPPREEQASRSCSVERVPLLKEQHGTHAAPVKGGVKTNLGDPSPSSSATPPSGRGRGFPPRVPGRTSSVILHPSDTSQDMEIPTDADIQSTPGSDQDGMEWETASRKSRKKQPVVAPK